jgi:hypothetical protein
MFLSFYISQMAGRLREATTSVWRGAGQPPAGHAKPPLKEFWLCVATLFLKETTYISVIEN